MRVISEKWGKMADEKGMVRRGELVNAVCLSLQASSPLRNVGPRTRAEDRIHLLEVRQIRGQRGHMRMTKGYA